MAELSQKTVCFLDKSPDWLRRKSFGDFPKSSRIMQAKPLQPFRSAHLPELLP
jgi:hypothetical protein